MEQYIPYSLIYDLLVVDVNNLKYGRKPAKLQKENPAGTLGKVNSVKEIRRRGKDSLKINRQQLYVRKKVSRAVSVRCL